MKHIMINYNHILGDNSLQLHYMYTDSLVKSITSKDFIKDLRSLEDLFDYSNLSENHQLFSNKKNIGRFKNTDS